MGILKKITEFVNEAIFSEIVTFDDCLEYFEKSKKQYPQIYAFVLSVEKNQKPKNFNVN